MTLWTALTGSLLLALAAGDAAAAAADRTRPVGDPVRGQAVFARCLACHTVAAGQNRLGPSLAGVVGRRAAAVPGFRYSPAMQKSRQAWTRENLDRFIAAPAAAMPGNTMSFPGVPDARDRADLIAYLTKTGGDPKTR